MFQLQTSTDVRFSNRCDRPQRGASVSMTTTATATSTNRTVVSAIPRLRISSVTTASVFQSTPTINLHRLHSTTMLWDAEHPLELDNPKVCLIGHDHGAALYEGEHPSRTWTNPLHALEWLAESWSVGAIPHKQPWI